MYVKLDNGSTEIKFPITGTINFYPKFGKYENVFQKKMVLGILGERVTENVFRNYKP